MFTRHWSLCDEAFSYELGVANFSAIQYERARTRRPRGRNRPAADCHEGVEPEEDPPDRAPVSA